MPEQCPTFIDFMCPVCGIITDEIHGYHPMAQGIGVAEVIRRMKESNTKSTQRNLNEKESDNMR